MGRNGYFFVAGIISLVFAGAHTWWGVSHALPGIGTLGLVAYANAETSWHQVGGTFLIGGVALLHEALYPRPSVIVPALVGSIHAMTLLVFVVLVGTRYPAMFARTIPQMVLFSTMLALIAAGIAWRRRSVGDDAGG